MQKNDFEKQVQKELEDFTLLPDDVIWQKVEARVRKDKKRRRIFFFWMIAGILLLGGGAGFWLMSNPDDNHITSIPAEKITASNKKDQESQNKHPKDVSTTKQINAKISENDKAESSKHVQLEEQKVTAQLTHKTDYTIKRDLIRNNKTGNGSIILKNEIKTEEMKNDEFITAKESLTTNKELPNIIKPEIENVIKKEEETVSKIASKPTPSPVENSSVTSKKVVKQNKKPLLFGALVLGGFSNNVTSVPLFSEAKSNESNQQSPASFTLGQSSTADMSQRSKYSYTSSFSWGAGVFAQKSIDKKWGISFGFNYQLMSANITVGARVDSSNTFRDSALRRSSPVSSFYRSGSNNKYRNEYHLLQIPVNLLFQLNKNPDKPLAISAGITGGILAGSNALYYNGRTRTYYKEREHLKRLMLNVQTGLTFTLSTKGKYHFEAGPHIQYQMSNLTKPVIRTDEHLWFLGLKGNILFKKLNK